MNDVAVHMFPVEKQMLLQMRLRQMHGRQPADLITTPAKQMPVRSLGAGMVSSSHVGPPQLSSLPLHACVSQPEMQLPAAALYDGPPATAEMPYRQHEPPTTAGKVPSDIPPFEDLHHCEGAATMQQAEADMNVVQHAMIDPGIHAQWPMPSEAHMPAQQRRSVPLQHLQHEQQQLHPSYAWSTQQLTAIAATAATAAAAAFQQEINAQQTALAVATDSVKSAEQMQIRIGALQNPEVRQGMQAAAQFVDAQTTTDTANLGSSRESKQVAGISLAPAPLADMGRDLRQSEQPKKQQAVPKQSVALHKLKHRSSASRGLAGQARFISQAKDQAAPAKSPTGSIERSDKLAPDDHQRMHSRMQQVCSCVYALSMSSVPCASVLHMVLCHSEKVHFVQ